MNLVEIIKDVKTALKRGFLWMLLPALLIAAYMGYSTKQEAILHVSYSKIFPLSADGGGGLSSLGAQLGLEAQGGAAQYYNVTELVHSRNLSRKMVQYPSNSEKHKALADWIIEDFKKRQKNKTPETNKVSDQEKVIAAAEILTTSAKIVTEKSEFTAIKVETGDPELSLRLNECILTGLSDFYISTKTEKARTDLEKIGTLRDSLKKALNGIELSLLNFGERSKYLVSETAKLPSIQLQSLREEVSAYYASATESYQNAKFMLVNQSPIFQVLDKPQTPVIKIVPKWKKSAIMGFFIGFFLGLIIALRKVIGKLIMAELNSEN
jgi:hypothetical protein